MASFSPQSSLAQLLAADSLLLSPISAPDGLPWDSINTDAFLYTTPPSPAESLMSSLSPETSMQTPEPEQPFCISTQEVFDLPQIEMATEPNTPQKLSISIKPRASISSASSSSKRSASPAPTVAKKARSSGERTSSKDFIPPDVSGLSKREARLVKNRAAAFLSRQRKREEFEQMEVRLAELEKENARLLAMTQGETVQEPEPQELVSEVEQLRAQLAAAEERERQLSAKLKNPAVVKTEVTEQSVPSSPKSSPLRSSASLGLMVLLCALPSLLSMPSSNHHIPSTFSSSSLMSLAPPTSAAFDYNSFISNDFEWGKDFSSNGMMDLDIDDQGRISTADSALSFPSLPPSTQTLAFDTLGQSNSAELLGQLGQLDISFDASQRENGKIRVRIHPSSGSNTASRASSPPLINGNGDLVMKDEFLSSQPDSYSLSGDPFLLGVGASSSDWLDDMPMPGGYDHPSPGLDSDFDSCSTVSGSGKRRVRIALKSAPTSGGEGGEWEVQFC